MILRRLLLLGLCLFVFSGYRADAQGNGPSWRVISATRIVSPTAAPDNIMNADTIYAAPDGHRFAYLSPPGRFCVRDLLTDLENCLPLPENFPPGLGMGSAGIFWSPDGSKIAYNGVPFFFGVGREYLDTDLWLIDLANETIVNLTDDGYSNDPLPDEGFSVGCCGLLFPQDGTIVAQTTPVAPIEMNIRWSPNGTEIAVERVFVVQGGEPIWPSRLSLIDISSGETTDIVTELPGGEGLDAGIERGIGGIGWSPDGSALTFSVHHRQTVQNNQFYAPDGTWAVDRSGENLIQVLDPEDARRAAFPVFSDLAYDASFSFDVSEIPTLPGETLVYFRASASFFTENTFRRANWFFWLETDSREIGHFPLPTYLDDQGESHTIYPQGISWMHMARSPEGALLVAFKEQRPHAGGSVLPLDDSAPDNDVSLYLLDPATGESTLLGNLPDLAAYQPWAVWGENGHVIINGYHLEMVQE